MTDTPISPLRQRMIEDMTIRKFARRTQEGYIRSIKSFSTFLGASPAKASFEDIRRYQLHLASSGAGAPTINHNLTALRFLFMVTLRKPDVVMRLPFVRKPRKLPVVLSPEEVERMLEAAPGLKYKAALSVAYGAGLRVSEIISLKISDIDSARMVIRVEQGKGNKDRYVMLSPHLLELLRIWWKAAKPKAGCFRGRTREGVSNSV
jgi:site-specific recombinase XerD